MKIALLPTFICTILFSSTEMFNDVLEKKLGLGEEIRIMEIKGHATDLGYEELVLAELECKGCQRVGTHTTKVLSKDGNTRYVTFKTGKVVKALTAKIDLGPYTPKLSKNNFEFKEVVSDRPENLMTTKESVHFYKLNKKVSNGEALKINDLVAVDLVRYGEPIDVFIKKNGIVLKGRARALQNGKIGQRVRLENNRTRKIYMGTVIDNNQVEVKL